MLGIYLGVLEAFFGWACKYLRINNRSYKIVLYSIEKGSRILIAVLLRKGLTLPAFQTLATFRKIRITLSV
jgi:hypothetical protein